MFLLINNIELPNNIAQSISLQDASCEVRNDIVIDTAKTSFINNYKIIISCLNRVNKIPILIPAISQKTFSLLLPSKVFVSAGATNSSYGVNFNIIPDCHDLKCHIVSIEGTKITSSTKTPVEKYLEQYRDFTIKFDKQPIKAGYITLINKQIGFFIPSICITSCTPASIIWEQNGFQYQIDMQARGTNEDLKWISYLANSAIENKFK